MSDNGGRGGSVAPAGASGQMRQADGEDRLEGEVGRIAPFGGNGLHGPEEGDLRPVNEEGGAPFGECGLLGPAEGDVEVRVGTERSLAKEELDVIDTTEKVCQDA